MWIRVDGLRADEKDVLKKQAMDVGQSVDNKSCIGD